MDESTLLRRPELTRRPSPDALALLAITAVVLLVHAPYLVGVADFNPLGPRSGLVASISPGRLPGERTIDPNNGFISQALSHRAVLDWLDLKVPWWNPYEGTGAPLAGEMQSAAFFPPTLLTYFENGQLFERILLEVVAGFATYLLLRRLRVSPLAATAGAIAFALNGSFAWLSHAPVNPVPFLPLLLLGIEQAYGAAGAVRRGGWWLIAGSGALSLYAGFPEVAYLDGLLAIGWFAWRMSCLRPARRMNLARKAAAGVAVGTLLSAPLLIASADYLAYADLGGHGSGAFGKLHLPGRAIPQLILPYAYGPIFGFGDPHGVLTGIWSFVGGYLTSGLVFFAALGLMSKGRRGLRIILFAWLVLALTRIYGHPALPARILGVLPGMSRIAFLRYSFPSVELATIILAALGLDEIGRSPSRRRVLLVAAAVLGIVVIAAFGARPLARQLGAGFHEHHYLRLSVAWAIVVVAAGAGVAFVRNLPTRRWMATLLLVCDSVVLFVIPTASAPRSVKVDRAPVTYLERHLGTSRFFTLGPIQPNYGSYYGLGSLNINDIPIPKPLATYIQKRLDPFVGPTVFVGNLGGGRAVTAPSPVQELLRNLDGYRAASVAYVLTPPGQQLPVSRRTFQLVYRSPSTWIYRLTGAVPYFSATDERCAVTAHGRSSAVVTCPTYSRLVRRETYLPGWTATVDGRPAPISKVDGLFQAVRVGPGMHRVTFAYSPRHMAWGVAALAAGVMWLLFPTAQTGRRRSRRRPDSNAR